MKIELKNIKHYEGMSEETFCFEASLCVNGKKIGRVSNRGCGGCHDYDFSWKEEEKLDEWCRTNLPKWKMSDDPLIPDADKKHPEITKERDTSLETHINSLVCNFLEKKDLKKVLHKAVVVMDDTCGEFETWKWKFSEYGLTKTELIKGVLDILDDEKKKKPVILNTLPFEEAFNIYYKRGNL